MLTREKPIINDLIDIGFQRTTENHLMPVAKLRLLDFLGAMVDGYGTRTADLFLNISETVGGNHQSTYFARNVKTSILNAAAGNAAVGHANETDDIHSGTTGYHPGVTIIPAVLATAENYAAGGEQILKSIIFAYEISGRIGAAMAASHRKRGFHATGTIGALGAAAGSAFVAGLVPEKIASSVGLATSMAGGTFGILAGGSQSKHLHAAHAAYAGCYATLLTVAGMRGASRALEAKGGFFDAFSDTVHFKSLPLIDGRAEIERVVVKPYPCCAHAYGAIEAAIALSAEIRPADVQSAEIHTYSAAAVLDNTKPDDPESAKLSVPFCFAGALLQGGLSSPAFSMEGRSEIQASGLVENITLVDSPDANSVFPRERRTTVFLKMKNGNGVSKTVSIYPDEPDPRPLDEVILNKFRAATTPVFGKQQISEIESFIMTLDSKADAASRLGELLALNK